MVSLQENEPPIAAIRVLIHQAIAIEKRTLGRMQQIMARRLDNFLLGRTSARAQTITDNSSAIVVTTNSTTIVPTYSPVPSPTPTEIDSTLIVGVLLGSLAAILLVVAFFLYFKRRRRTQAAQIIFKPAEIDDSGNKRRAAEPYASVYATDFASDYRDSHSPTWTDGAVMSDPSRRKDRAHAELEPQQPPYFYYHTSRRSSIESQDSSIISYAESDKGARFTTTSSTEETPREHHTTQQRDDSLASSKSFTNVPAWGSANSMRMSSFSSEIGESPLSAFSLPEKVSMLDDSASQASSRESYDI